MFCVNNEFISENVLEFAELVAICYCFNFMNCPYNSSAGQMGINSNAQLQNYILFRRKSK